MLGVRKLTRKSLAIGLKWMGEVFPNSSVSALDGLLKVPNKIFG